MAVPPLSDLLAAAEATAVSAGKQARHLLGQPREVSSKGYRDLVTDADIAAQKVITEAILNRFPDHGFLPEEEAADLPTTGPVIWIIDPIDGTINYSRGQTNFCVSVAATEPIFDEQSLIKDFKPLVGAIYDPIREELFSAARGVGAFLVDGHGRKSRCQVSQITQLEESVLLFDVPGHAERRQKIFDFMKTTASHVFTFRNLGSATLALAWVAIGRADAYFNINVRPWDLAAAQVIIEEAGGTITNIHNQPLSWLDEVMDCLASNGRLHSHLLEKI